MKPKARALNTTADGQLACSHGEIWLGPHPICQAHTAASCGVSISEVILPDYSHLRHKALPPAPCHECQPEAEIASGVNVVALRGTLEPVQGSLFAQEIPS